MARINIVTPTFSATRFTGGIWCLMEYAAGLAARGHEVTVIPFLPRSEHPQWFDRPVGQIRTLTTKACLRRVCESAVDCARNMLRVILRQAPKRVLKPNLRGLAENLLFLRPGLLPQKLTSGVSTCYLPHVMPQADVTMATAWQTVLPVRMCGTGRLFYFMMHYEPYLAIDNSDPRFGEAGARMAYELNLEMIANSSWLKNKIEAEFPGRLVHLCPNAIDHKVFAGKPRTCSQNSEVAVISYSGRGVTWKGFREMAEAVKIARDYLPEVNLRWMVYGGAIPPPEKCIANYEPLGFLNHASLAKAYVSADILLSASWYESFPLFPLEAMACGLPVITTPLGTEDFAIHGETAEVVEPKDPKSIAEGLIRLIKDPSYRYRIAKGGNEISKGFTWERSVSRLERILLSSPSQTPVHKASLSRASIAP